VTPQPTFLPSLYSIDKKNKSREWTVSYLDDTIFRLYGEEGGALIQGQRKFTGKNIGRANQTTASEQAHQEALSEWIEHIDKGYVPRCEQGIKLARVVEKIKQRQNGVLTGIPLLLRLHSSNIEKLIEDECETPIHSTVSTYKPRVDPMLCEKFENKPKVMKHLLLEKGVYVQPKYDGTRSLASYDSSTESVMLTTRGACSYAFLDHIKTALKRDVFSKYPDVVLDGELYTETLLDENGQEYDRSTRFNLISSMCRPTRKTPHPLENQIRYYVFDFPSAEGNQDERFAALDTLLEEVRCPVIVSAPRKIVYSLDEIETVHNEWHYNHGYEGLIIRARDLMYEKDGGRSLKIRKYKHFHDDDFVVLGAECDQGVDTQYFRWVCQTKSGHEFRVKPDGSHAAAIAVYKKYIANPDAFKRRLLKVKYQDVDPTTGVPRFPVGIGFREIE
jgi:ATP-dependent DNA ligase